MRRLLLILVIFYTVGIHTQETTCRPIMEDGKEWIYIETSHLFCYYRYYLKEDTIIYGQLCKKMYRDFGVCEPLTAYDIEHYHPYKGEYCGAMLQDGKITKLYLPGENKPRHIYDFDVSTGSVLMDREWKPMRVIQEEMIEDSLSHEFRLIRMESMIAGSSEQGHTSWIEGIGCTYDLLLSCPIYMGGLFWEIYRCNVYNETIYLDKYIYNQMKDYGKTLPTE